MRIVFIGTVEFSYKALQKLIKLNANIVGVCTKKVSQFNSDFTDLTPICEQNKIPVLQVDNINSENSLNWIREKKPDIIFCFGWSSLIKKELLMLSPMGIVGYHPAKLPQNRGRHPLIWALALGLDKSASTFFFMEEGADDGDILSQVNFDITYTDNAKTLYNKITHIALNQIEKFLPHLQNRTYTKEKQNHKEANVWRKRGKKDGMIDFRMNSRTIYNLVRALTKPYIGAHIEYKDQDITIWNVEEVVYKKPNIEPGKILDIRDSTILVKTSDGAIRITEHEFKNLPKIGEYI